MARNLSLLALAVALVAPAANHPVHAREAVWQPAGEMRCSFSGWQHYQIKGPIRVRSAPSATARVLGTIPATSEPREYSVLFDILATRAGWVKITNASDGYNEGAGHPRRAVYKGEGWVPATAVLLGLQSGRGYVRPDATSRRVLDLKDKWLTDSAAIDGVYGCSGDWILLAYHLRRPNDEKPVPRMTQRIEKAWFRGVCPIEETTCDMREVDTKD